MPQNVANGGSVHMLTRAIEDSEVDLITVYTQVLAQDREKCSSPFLAPLLHKILGINPGSDDG